MDTLIGNQEFSQGTVDTSDFNITQGIKEIELFIDRTSLEDEKLAVAVQLFLSLDGGLSWIPWGGFGCCGGILENTETGERETKSGMISVVPNVELKNRKLRATLTMTQIGRTDLKCEMR